MNEYKPPVAGSPSRAKSMVNAVFAKAIIPSVAPLKSELDALYSAFELDPNHLTCVYCGKDASEWDHLNAVIVEKELSGYFTEINNLVPSCGHCNQSKGNKSWETWFDKKFENIDGSDTRKSKLIQFTKTNPAKKVNVTRIKEDTAYQEYEAVKVKINELLDHAATLLTKIPLPKP
jgi:endonuclease I